nr:hypothetical protein CFP56_66110 [Quercus suber]
MGARDPSSSPASYLFPTFDLIPQRADDDSLSNHVLTDPPLPCPISSKLINLPPDLNWKLFSHPACCSGCGIARYPSVISSGSIDCFTNPSANAVQQILLHTLPNVVPEIFHSHDMRRQKKVVSRKIRQRKGVIAASATRGSITRSSDGIAHCPSLLCHTGTANNPDLPRHCDTDRMQSVITFRHE